MLSFIQYSHLNWPSGIVFSSNEFVLLRPPLFLGCFEEGSIDLLFEDDQTSDIMMPMCWQVLTALLTQSMGASAGVARHF